MWTGSGDPREGTTGLEAQGGDVSAVLIMIARRMYMDLIILPWIMYKLNAPTWIWILFWIDVAYSFLHELAKVYAERHGRRM